MSLLERDATGITSSEKGLRISVSVTKLPELDPRARLVKPNSRRSTRTEIIPVSRTKQLRRQDAGQKQDARRKQLLYSALPEHDVLDTQMFALFYDSFLPPDLSPWRNISYLAFVAETVPGTQLLKAAKRVLGLTHLAHQSHNSAILQESRVLYSRLLNALNYTLHFPNGQTRDILATMSLMTHMNNSLDSAARQDDTWAMHLSAAQQLLMLQGPRHLQVDRALDQGILRHICGNSFWLAIARRKSWSIHPAWLKMQTKGWADLLEVFSDLPTILEETDGMLKVENNLSVLLKLLSRLHHITRLGRMLFTTVQDRPTEKLMELRKRGIKAERHFADVEPSAFSDFYAPMDQLDTQRILSVTLLLLITECTILRIWTLRPETLILIPQDLHQAIQQNVDRLARRLCKMSLSLMQADGVVTVLTLQLCLKMAYNVFEQQHATAEMNWCSAALTTNQKRLDLVRSKGPPTLCKLEHVTPGILEAGRYGSEINRQACALSMNQGTCPRG